MICGNAESLGTEEQVLQARVEDTLKAQLVDIVIVSLRYLATARGTSDLQSNSMV